MTEQKHTPYRIWARLDRATVYMDGSSPLVASTRKFPGSSEYVAASVMTLLVAEMPDEDDIEEAISGSIDIDWTPRDAAREVMRLLAKGVNRTRENGEPLEKGCPNDPGNDPKNENVQQVIKALIDLELYLRDTPHHNAPQAAAARAAIAKATGSKP